MLSRYRRWRLRRLLDRSDLSPGYWSQAWDGIRLLDRLSPEAGARLRELATLFLAEKTVNPAGDLRITRGMRQYIALQACIPLIGLDLDWYRSWQTIVLYPDTFVSTFDEEDDAGVVHRVREPRMGESWDQGPLILSWVDTLASGEALDGYNVVVHECAHKLDALDGAANGRPPLHPDMSPQQWADVFGEAYEDLCRLVDGGSASIIDPYGAEAPEEFFAVVTEAFFEVPWDLLNAYPPVYEQLKLFYRQDPVLKG